MNLQRVQFPAISLACILLILTVLIGLWLARRPTVDPYHVVTFQEVEQLLKDAEEGKLTQLQAGNLCRRWEGRRVIWDGFVKEVTPGMGSGEILVNLNPYFANLEDRSFWAADRVWAQAHFASYKYKAELLELWKGQPLRVDCEFDRVLTGNVPVLQDCRLVPVVQPGSEPEPPLIQDPNRVPLAVTGEEKEA